MVIIVTLYFLWVVEEQFRDPVVGFAGFFLLFGAPAEDLGLEFVDGVVFLQVGEVGSHGLDLSINFAFNFQHFFLLLQLQRPLLFALGLLHQSGLVALLVLDVLGEDGVL